MAFGKGKTLLTAFTIAGREYNFVAVVEEDFTMFSTCLIEGDFTIERPTVLWTSSWVNYSTEGSVPAEYVNSTLASLNAFLATQFSGPVADTWIGKVEALFRRCVVVFEAGVPRIRVQ